MIVHMIRSHFGTLFQVMNLIVLQKFNLKHYQCFIDALDTQPHQWYLLSEISSIQILITHVQTLLRSSMFHRSYIKDYNYDRIPQY